MAFSWNSALIDQVAFAWEVQFLPRLEGLSDAEYLWEPVPGCWSVRQDVTGGWSQDLSLPEPEPPPFTTIAWRLAHMAEFFSDRASNQFGDGRFSRDHLPLTGRAEDAIAVVTDAYTRWTDGVRALGEDGLFRPCGASEGSFADEPMLALVLHLNREFLHHAAEVGTLRDLYRDTAGKGVVALSAAG